jgi:hypothetical protein
MKKAFLRSPVPSIPVAMYFAFLAIGASIVLPLWLYLNDNIAYLLGFILPMLALAFLERRQKKTGPLTTGLGLSHGLLNGVMLSSAVCFLVFMVHKHWR